MRIRHEQPCISMAGVLDPDDAKKQRGGKSYKAQSFVIRASFALSALATITVLLIGLAIMSQYRSAPKKRKTLSSTSPEDILSDARSGLLSWARGAGLPAFGLTEGIYPNNGKFCFHCGAKTYWCIGKNSSTDRPPPELLIPGRLAPRSLSETSECFLWYAKELYTRPAGGPRGFWAQRIGGEIDNRIVFLDALRRYELHHGCREFQVCMAG